MERFAEGADRYQIVLPPDRLENCALSDNPVRVVDAFADAHCLAPLDTADRQEHKAAWMCTTRIAKHLDAPGTWTRELQGMGNVVEVAHGQQVSRCSTPSQTLWCQNHLTNPGCEPVSVEPALVLASLRYPARNQRELSLGER